MVSLSSATVIKQPNDTILISGPNDYESTSQYIQDKLVGLNRNTSKSIFSHFTNATDTHNIGFVFEAVVEIFLEHNLKQAGLV